jgi:hypothetical protein
MRGGEIRLTGIASVKPRFFSRRSRSRRSVFACRVSATFFVDNRGEEMRKSYPVLLILCTTVSTLAVYQRKP